MISVAKIIKSNGTDGGLLISSPVDFESLDFADPVYIVFDGLQVPFFVQSCEEHGSRYIIHLNDVSSLEDAEEVVGRDILADVETEDDTEQNFSGWTVFDGKKKLGVVTGDEPIPGNYCIYVSRFLPTAGAAGGGKDIMIPLHEDFIVSADTDTRELVLRLPEGLY